MSAFITNHYRVLQAQQLLTEIAAGTNTYYLGIAKQYPWTNDAVPDTPSNSFGQLVEDYRTMIAIKKITGSNVTGAITQRLWTYGTVYTMYDDADVELMTKNFYVVNSTYDIYKCIDNNLGAQSTVQPTGTGTTIFSTADGYLWKYMGSVNAAKLASFPSQSWLPVATLAASDGSAQWNTQQAAINGGLHTIIVTNGGSGYSGSPTVDIVGNGSGAVASCTIVGGVITKITVSNPGTGYTFATVTISGNGTGATARAVISPIGGHGKDIESELGASNSMLNVVLNQSEGGVFPVVNEYRKIVLLKNPFNYGTSTRCSASVLDCTTKLTLSVFSGTFAQDEVVTQAVTGATGKVVDWDSTNKILRINDTNGTWTQSQTLSGATSGATGTVAASGVTNSGMEPYSGVLFYKDYRTAISRSADQRESISIVLAF